MSKTIPKLDWQLDDLVLFTHLQERTHKQPRHPIHFTAPRWGQVQEFMEAIGQKPESNGTYKYLGSVLEAKT